MPLGTELGLGPDHIVLDWNLTKRGNSSPTLRPMSIVAGKPKFLGSGGVWLQASWRVEDRETAAAPRIFGKYVIPC